jgi:O-antigen/teichoic acid export membrane protein
MSSNTTLFILIVTIVFYAIWLFQDDITRAYNFMGSNVSYKTLRDVLFILLGIDVKWGIDSMSPINWGIVIIASLVFIIGLCIIKAIEDKNTEKQRLLDWQYWDTMERVMKEAVKKGIQEAKQEEPPPPSDENTKLKK